MSSCVCVCVSERERERESTVCTLSTAVQLARLGQFFYFFDTFVSLNTYFILLE